MSHRNRGRSRNQTIISSNVSNVKGTRVFRCSGVRQLTFRRRAHCAGIGKTHEKKWFPTRMGQRFNPHGILRRTIRIVFTKNHQISTRGILDRRAASRRLLSRVRSSAFRLIARSKYAHHMNSIDADERHLLDVAVSARVVEQFQSISHPKSAETYLIAEE